MPVSDSHQSLCHYTSAAGLEGIIREQKLRATNIGFLNDSEERTGYFKRRLPHVLLEPVRESMLELLKTPEGAAAIAEEGGRELAEEKLLKHLCEVFQQQHEELDEPFVTSFCVSDAQHPNDGLLSQWRGYGDNGAYAIVFNTRRIEDLMLAESQHCYQSLFLSDVEYADPSGRGEPRYPETKRYEADIKSAVKMYIATRASDSFEPMFTAMSALPCLFKHHGFREEGEVRIVAIPMHDQFYETENTKPRKTISFRTNNGLLVPYLNLFDGESKSKLPIERVIVGPSADSTRRKKSVEMLLKRYGVEASVVVSGIPYLGR
jgi:hypothetical protein